jgi:hypothetical protein
MRTPSPPPSRTLRRIRENSTLSRYSPASRFTGGNGRQASVMSATPPTAPPLLRSSAPPLLRSSDPGSEGHILGAVHRRHRSEHPDEWQGPLHSPRAVRDAETRIGLATLLDPVPPRQHETRQPHHAGKTREEERQRREDHDLRERLRQEGPSCAHERSHARPPGGHRCDPVDGQHSRRRPRTPYACIRRGAHGHEDEAQPEPCPVGRLALVTRTSCGRQHVRDDSA